MEQQLSAQGRPAGATATFFAGERGKVRLLCLAQLTLWSLAPMLANSAPPLDVVENTVWGPEWVISTFKNPTLSTVLMELARLLTGGIGWPAYILAQLCICLTFLAVYALGRDGLGPSRALAGTALLTGVVYFSWTTPEFNNDVNQMPFWAGLWLALWRATQSGKLFWWLVLAACAVLGLYAKLAMGVALITGGLWMLWDDRARARLSEPGPWIALALFAVGVAPLVWWLVAHDFQPLVYATARGKTNSASGLGFLFDQVEAAIPMALLALAACFWPRPVTPGNVREIGPAPIDPRFNRYLLVTVLAPLAITVLATLIMHTGVKRMWGVPMLDTLGLVVVMVADPRRLDALARARIVRGAFGLILAGSLAYTLVVGSFPNIPQVLRGKNELLRQNWPQPEIATRMRALWARDTGNAPLGIVAGEVTNWVAGLIALAGPGRPPASVYTEANQLKSPWITDARLKSEGALVVWQERGYGPPDSLKSLIGGRPLQVEDFPLTRYPSAPPVKIGYVVVPPG